MKTKRITAMLAMALLAASPLSAQTAPTAAPSVLNVRGAQFPRVNADHSVTFQVRAPEAHKVQINLGKLYDLTRQPDGTWTGTTEPQSEGFHYYFLVVDGVQVADPAAETFFGCSMQTSGLEIPYPEATASKFALRDVPRGDVHRMRYYSKLSAKWKNVYVYTPPTYASDTRAYPVLYLQHGGGEDERGWTNQGLTDIIMDNLIADGKAVPMVIVMMDGNAKDFTAELVDEGMPFVRQHFRIREGRENTALAGLSMGGIQTLNAIVARPELFAYAGVFSSGWFRTTATWMASAYGEPYYQILKDHRDEYNRNYRLLWFSEGGPEDIAYDNGKAMLARFDEIGIKYDYFEYPGGHTWPVWRESLWQFAQKLFK